MRRTPDLDDADRIGELSCVAVDPESELLAAEREALLSLRDEGKISPEVMRRIERDLDLQESRLGG